MEKQESAYNMIDWWKKVLFKNYANFQGRARRAEFWNYTLFNFIIFLVLYFVVIVGLLNEADDLGFLGVGILMVYALGVFIPDLAVLVRRLHDINKSGWNILFYFIPLVGPILILVWMFTDGDRFANNYGEDPKNPGIPELEFTGESH